MGLVKVRAALSAQGGERYQKSVEFFGFRALLGFSLGQLLSGMVLLPVSAAACRGLRRCRALNALASSAEICPSCREDTGPSWALPWQHQLGYSP